MRGGLGGPEALWHMDSSGTISATVPDDHRIIFVDY